MKFRQAVVLLFALPFSAIAALWTYKSATTPILHPDPQLARSVSSEEPSQRWAGAVERGRQIMRANLTQQNLPGLSVAVGVDGDIVWAEGFGYADLETQAAVTPKTRFRVGDASKALTSAAVGLLLEENKLRLADEIQVHVPEFPKKRWSVTVRQLMAQVGGVTAHHGGDGPLSNSANGDGNPAPRCERTVDGLQLDDFAERDLLFEPGTRYRPSSYGWILVSAAVEAAANAPFFAFMRTRVFEPLGMHDTTVDVWTDAIPDRATFYFPKFGLAADTRYGPKLARQGDHSCYAGAGAFLSTPSDLVRFGIGAQAGTLLQPSTLQLLQTPQRLASGKETGYGLGWELETPSLAGQPTLMAGHGSKEDFIGAATNLMTFPDRGLVIAVMANISFADTRPVALNIAQAFAETLKDTFTGKWEGSFTVQRPDGTDGDSDPILYNLTQKGKELTGTFGDADNQWKVEKGVIDAGTATFEVQQPGGPLFKFTLQLIKGKLEGEMLITRNDIVRARARIEMTKSAQAAQASTPAKVVRIAELNTRQIRALDRDKTVVFLQGGMLEEHGPYLPAFTDGILSERLTLEVANGVAAKKPDWTALMFPPVSVGASGYNEIGGHFVFPGTYAVRPSTLKSIYMDLATQLGEQGFKWIMVVHVHGSPLHIAALDEAGDYFRDTFGGRMVNLWGLLPVIGGWGTGMNSMTPAQRKEDGVSLHGGADEHSLMLHLQPDLVATDYLQAPTVTGATYAESVAAARQKDWPGYLGSPRLGTAALGRSIWTSFSSTALNTTMEILGGADPAKYPRYLPFMESNPPYREWIAAATARDRALGDRQQSWNARRSVDTTGNAAAELTSLEAVWNKAHLAGDAAALDRLWADDVVIFVPKMRPMNKAEAMASFKDGSTTFTRFETSDLHPRVTGDLAVVTGRLQRTRPSTSLRAGGGPASEEWLFRKVYRRDASGWRVISYHGWEPPK